MPRWAHRRSTRRRGRAGRCSTAAARSRRLAAYRSSIVTSRPSSITPASSHCRSSLSTRRSEIRRSTETSAACRGRCCRSSPGCPRRARGCPASLPACGDSPAPASRSRLGRNPYEHARKSASKIGSRTSFAAICTTRSRTVGMPSGRVLPSAFGMYRRRTACGRYVPARNSVWSLFQEALYSVLLDARRSSEHRRPPRPCSASLASTLPTGRHSCRCGRTARGTVAPGAAWPRPTAGVGVVALCPVAAAPGGSWAGSSVRPCPRAYLLLRHDSPQGPFPPVALFVAAILGTTTPSDFRCAALDFAFGLYEPPCRDNGRADGSLVFRTSPSTRAAPHTPPRSRTHAPVLAPPNVAFAVT